MSLEVIAAILSILERGAAAARAMEGVADVIRQKQAKGEEVTLDDLKQYSLADDDARNVLVDAINAAESQ